VAEYALLISDEEVRRYQLMASHAREAEQSLWRTAGIVPGARVADVGCGPGAVTLLLAEAVEPGGSVVGIDGDDEALATAARLLGNSTQANVNFRHGNALSPLEGAPFDAIMMRHVLAHNGRNEQHIVNNLAGCLRTGGCLYLVDMDFHGFGMEPDDADISELGERYRAFHQARGNDLAVGRRLGDLLETAGLGLVEFTGRIQVAERPRGIRPATWAARASLLAEGFIDATDVARYEEAFARLDTRARQLRIFVSVFTAIGRRT
jgi:ubiquinone/menaquinone biosynthesis C-methylase UbiE